MSNPVPGLATLLLKRGGFTRVLPGASGLRPWFGTAGMSAPVRSSPRDSRRLLLLLFRGRSVSVQSSRRSAPPGFSSGSSSFGMSKPPLLRPILPVNTAGSQWEGWLFGLLP
ncbi:hypothetical protein NDU88_004061 [Pleurodeles waltl]|uniref:Uncharacterized protein n=1 Tax=Pleurodeles waltl TaxID=8319 RepID=A0AAV7TQ77_PLEWA|nr:hypothetical protein NDU88_004061 [Pleurodeles waltl]